MPWTEDRVEILAKLWGEGKSASLIAKELGGVTRNAVIGKVHRLGLSNRAGNGGTAAAKDSASKPKVAAPPPVPPADPKPVPESKAEPPATRSPLQRKPIITAGQPLPPQPSANEISPEALASVREVEKTARKLDLMQLTERTCKWPIGDPATEEFWFCGLPAQPGKPYCEAHVGVAFQPMSSRRDRKR